MQRNRSFWIRLLACIVAALAISSFLLPMEGRGEDWIPLFSGYLNLSFIYGSPLVSALLGGAFNVMIVASMLAINTRTVNNAFNPSLSAALFLFITLLNPEAVHFSSIHPAVLLFVWGQYCFLVNQKFTSMFLLSCSALFYAPLIWVLPAVLVISVSGAADIPRVAMKSLGGLMLPLIYLLCFRFMMFGDAMVFVEEYISNATAVSSPVYSLDFTQLFLLLCIVVVALHSISYMFGRWHRNSIVTGHILKMEFMSVVLGAVLFFLFCGEEGLPVNMITALPLAMLLSYYFTGNMNAAAARIELILLCCAAVISRLSFFI